MAVTMTGREVAEKMSADIAKILSELRQKGVTPTLGVVRVGERPDDLSYEKGLLKRFESLELGARVFAFPEDIVSASFVRAFGEINKDPSLHGVLLFRPLPKHIDALAVTRGGAPGKDVDGMTDLNMSGVFSGDSRAFAPCTPSAVMEILDFYGVGLSGKNVVIVGRSMVVGRALAMLMLSRDATVTICHSKTVGTEAICRAADVVVAAVGKPRFFSAQFFSPHSVVVDVGINVDKEGRLCGDVDYDSVAPIAAAITPVPGGVGAVTTSVLAKHVLEAAWRTAI